MSPTITTFIFEIANFLVLAGALGWFFFRPARDSIQKRRQHMQSLADEAAETLAESQRLKNEIVRRHESLEEELNKKRNEARLAAEDQAESILRASRDAARREMESADQRLAHLEQGQREHLARVIATVAGESIDRLLRAIDRTTLDHLLTVTACRELEKLDRGTLAPVRIESAHSLPVGDREALLKTLGKAGESADTHVIPELGCGVRIATNHGLVDASSAGIASFATERLDSLLGNEQDGRQLESTDE